MTSGKGIQVIFDRLYRWAMEAGTGPKAYWAVGGVSFAESALLPLPVDAILVPVMLADRRQVWRAAMVATLASVAGGCAGYLIGYLLYETLVTWLIHLYSWEEAFQRIQDRFHEEGVWIVLIGAITPLPFKLIAIASGVQSLPFVEFLLAALAGRGVRFGAVAVALYYFGPQIRRLLDRHVKIIGWIVVIVLILGFVAVEWVF
ncbi:MAG: YqaA family protein [Pseudomonadota bacterium]